MAHFEGLQPRWKVRRWPAGSRGMGALALLTLLVCITGDAAGQSLTEAPIMVIAISRSIERVLIVAFSGLSLFLGFRLFAITTSLQGTAEFKHLKTTIKLQNLAQGTFFALFGAVVMIFSIWKSFDISVPTQSGTTHVAYVIGIPALKRQDVAKSLTTLQRYFQASTNSADRNDDQAQKAVDILTSLREPLVDQQFGVGTYKTYLKLQALKSNPAIFEQELASQHQGEVFSNVEDFITRPLGEPP